MTIVPFQVIIVDDDITEGSETFTLSIDRGNLPYGAVTNNLRSISVIIEDNDSKLLIYVSSS